MITKPKARRFRIRRSAPLVAELQPAVAAVEAAAPLRLAAGGGVAAPRLVAAGGDGPVPVRPPVQAPVQAAAGRPRPATTAPVVEDGFGDEPFPTAPDLLPIAAAPPEAELEAIRREGLTGRQLRLARRMAQKHDLPATSDFDAVRLLRRAGIDPFQRANVLDLVVPATAPGGGGAGEGGGSRALATVPASPNLPQVHRPGAPGPHAQAEVSHAADILRIQRDIARRRRRNLALLALRLMVFVGLPTLLAGLYYARIATPMYATTSEFVIQQAESQAAGGLGSLFSGTQFATSQDSIAVQGYLQSRDAMLRLDRDVGFRSHFTGAAVDALQRLEPGATDEAAYKLYRRHVRIGYDPTEGIIKMEVSGPDPAVSAAWSRALISYAEQQVDTLTQRLREDQMSGARKSYEEAEANMLAAQSRTVDLQERFKVLSSEVEVTLITTQITNLETQLTQDRLSLIQMQSNETPNRARMEPLQRRIATLEEEIRLLRARLTEDGADGLSLAKVQSELVVAQADVQTRQLLLAQALQQLETARIEANRQVRYLSVSVSPVAPDEASYPRAFENTAVAMLVFAGIYLMVSMTAAILREQVTA
jgi:capsular polysaccharide transport system permease protein